MLIHHNLSFHNAAELLPHGPESWQPLRVPQSLREKLSSMGRQRLGEPFGIEIRFVNEAAEETVEICLSSPDEEPANFIAYCGELSAPNPVPIPKEPTWFSLQTPERLSWARREHFEQSPFSLAVNRLVLQGRSLRYHGVRGGSVRPPTPEELPARTLLAYGTSLTQGSCSWLQPLTYPSLLGRALGMDVLNLGSGGSGFCEPEMTDYLASLEWDAAVLDPVTNLMAQEYALEEFQTRLAYLVDTLTGSHPGKPIVCLAMTPSYCPNGNEPGRMESFRDAVAECANGAHDRVVFVDANPVINIYPNYSVDLIHPSPHGYLAIAQCVEPHLRKLLSENNPTESQTNE